MHDLLKPGLGFKDNKGTWRLSELDGVSSGNTPCTFQLTKLFFGNDFYPPPIEVSPGCQLHHCFLQGLMTKPEPLVKMEVVKLNLMFFMK